LEEAYPRQAPAGPRPLLIFDQFEEFITLFEEAPRGDALKDAQVIQSNLLSFLAGLIHDASLAIKLLFVFREDYLAKLTKLFKLVPNLTDQYLRLTRLGTEALSEIIQGPFDDEQLKRHFGKEISEVQAQQWIQELKKQFGKALSPDLAQKLAHAIREKTEGV